MELRRQATLPSIELTQGRLTCNGTALPYEHDEGDDEASTIRNQERGDEHQQSLARLSTVSDPAGPLMMSPFEQILETSWVYRRNERNECDHSFVSSQLRPGAWSVFSGFSLADMSVFSVITMPLYPVDVKHGGYYKISVRKMSSIGTTFFRTSSQPQQAPGRYTSNTHGDIEPQAHSLKAPPSPPRPANSLLLETAVAPLESAQIQPMDGKHLKADHNHDQPRHEQDDVASISQDTGVMDSLIDN